MINILLFASAWGPLHGGINSFNMDLAIGLARVLGRGGRVLCAIPPFTGDEEAAASAENISLLALPLTGDDLDKKVCRDVEQLVLESLSSRLRETTIDLWIGHDTITGPLAIAAARHFAPQGRLALIHHMDYSEYKGYASDKPAHSGEQQQRLLFSTPGAHLFAVGPYLRQSCIRLSDVTDVTMLVPGFPAIQPIRDDGSALRAIVTGRLDSRHDRLKQGLLAVHAVGAAIESPEVAGLNGQPHLTIIGIDREDGKRLIREAEERAGRIVNVEPVPFDSDRGALLDRVRRSNLALMLSWHEGFGLTGWEAIGAGVPLIVSRHSGLYQLIEAADSGAMLPFVDVVDVQGYRGDDAHLNYTPEDLENTKCAIIRRVGNLSRSRAQALRLRDFLKEEHVCTWENTARTLLDASGMLPRVSSLPGHPVATTAETHEALNDLFGDNPFLSYVAEHSLACLRPAALVEEFSSIIRGLVSRPSLDSLVRAARLFRCTGKLGIDKLMDLLQYDSWPARQTAAALFQYLPGEEAVIQLFPRISIPNIDADEVRCVLEALGWLGRWESAQEMRELIDISESPEMFEPHRFFEVFSTYVLRAHVLIAALSQDGSHAVKTIDFYLKLLSERKVLDKPKLFIEWDTAAPLFKTENAYHLRSWIDEDELRCSLYINVIFHKRFVWALKDMIILARRPQLSTGLRGAAIRAIGEIGTQLAATDLLNLILDATSDEDLLWNEDLDHAACDAMAAMLHHLTDSEFDSLRNLLHLTPDGNLIAIVTNRKRSAPAANLPRLLSSDSEKTRAVSALCYAITEKQRAQSILQEFMENAPTTFDRFFLLLSLARAGLMGLATQIEQAVDSDSKWKLRGLSYFWRREVIFTLSLVSSDLATAWAETLSVDLESSIREAQSIDIFSSSLRT